MHNGRVSTENPFTPPVEDRDPVRRFRGRLAAPVTIVTAGNHVRRAGLTVSSLFVVEGEPGRIHLVVGPLTDLWDVMRETRRFVVHITQAEHHAMSDVFAGIRPAPGGPFAGLDTSSSNWGPVMESLSDRAYCSVVSMVEEGWSGVVEAEIDELELSESPDPLLYHRGRYRGLGRRV